MVGITVMGGACSRMKHALVPPMPKLLTTARRGCSFVSGKGISSSGKSNCHASHRMFGLRCCTLIVAGILPVYTHSAAFTTLATPAAPSMCPKLDFSDPISSGAARRVLQNAPLSARASVLSPATVPVPWASAYATVVGSVWDTRHTRSSNSCCISPRGFVMAGFAPSWFTPHPRITA